MEHIDKQKFEKESTDLNLEDQSQYSLSGAMYNDLTKELIEARERTILLTNEYNSSFGKNSAEWEKQ